MTIILGSCQNKEKTEVRHLNAQNWQYKWTNKQWKNTYIPESIENSLHRDTLIKQTLFRANFLKQTWIDTVSWQYKSFINIPQETSGLTYELNASGIVGKANVYFNDSLIFKIDDQFKKYTKDITSIIHKGKNYIRIKFTSIKNMKNFYSKKTKIPLPFNGLEMARYPYFYFHNKNGITIFPLGIKKNIQVIIWNKAIIRNISFKILDIKKGEYADIKAEYKIQASKKIDAKIQIINKSKYYIDQKINLKPGLNQLSFTFRVKKPKLWWTHDMGKPNLYNFYTKLINDKKTIQNIKTTIGIRQIIIDTTNHDFDLYLNGKPMTLKIINYNPPEIFYERYNKNSYYNYVKDFVLANINMVHIVQNGDYENDKFYEQCDKQGILVWQDFMLPYKIMPNENELYNNIYKETSYQIKRIKNHPCIAFWSGQNFFNKYWKKHSVKMNKIDSIVVRKFNSNIFKKLLPQLVNTFDSGSYYFEKMNFNTIVNITDKCPEYPHIETLRKFTTLNDRKIDSKIIKKYNQINNTDSILKKLFIKTYGNYPKDITGFMYLSNEYKESYFEQKILKQRFNTLFNGYIVGNYKDNTPYISTSAVDYNGHWKGKMYAIKRAFQPLLLRAHENKGWIYIDIKSDLTKDISPDFYFKLSNMDGKVFWRKNYLSTNIQAQTAKEYFSFNISRELAQIKRNNAIFKIDVFYNQELFAEKYFLFAPIKQIKLDSAEITKKYYKVDDGYAIELSTNHFAYGINVFTLKTGTLTDNYFCLSPGDTKKIIFITNNTIYGIKGAFKTINYTERNKRKLFNFKNF